MEVHIFKHPCIDFITILLNGTSVVGALDPTLLPVLYRQLLLMFCVGYEQSNEVFWIWLILIGSKVWGVMTSRRSQNWPGEGCWQNTRILLHLGVDHPQGQKDIHLLHSGGKMEPLPNDISLIKHSTEINSVSSNIKVCSRWDRKPPFLIT